MAGAITVHVSDPIVCDIVTHECFQRH